MAQRETRRAHTLMWLFAAVTVLLVGIIVFIVYATRQKRRRMQREMEFANIRADLGRQLTRQYIEGLENERQRMARELHDGVCNDLLAIQMNISAGKPMDTTASMIEICRESVRRISHEMMPPEFSYATLDEVMRFFISKQADANKGKIEFGYTSEAADASWSMIPDAVSLEIYRIAQEAVGNAVRHSGSDRIDVTLNLSQSMLKLVVRDNGTYKSNGRKGMGLDSIRRRVGAVNGSVSVDSGDKGTGISVKVNL